MATNRTQRKDKKRKQRERRIRLNQQRARAGMRDRVEEDDEPGRPSPTPSSSFDMERVLLKMSRATQAKDFGSREELQAYLNQTMDDQAFSPTGELGRGASEEAQELAYRSMESRDRGEAKRLAQEAVEIDPDCCDALTVLSLLLPTISERIDGLEFALLAGERALGGSEFRAENTGHYWGMVETRPYMRTRQALADQLKAAGLLKEAAMHYTELLQLNEGDNQGVRYSLLGVLLHREDLEAAGELFQRFGEEDSAAFLWGHVLLDFLRGDTPAALRCVKRAHAQNAFGAQELLSAHPLYSMDMGYTPGEESEAAMLRQEIGQAWRSKPKALAWLDGCELED